MNRWTVLGILAALTVAAAGLWYGGLPAKAVLAAILMSPFVFGAVLAADRETEYKETKVKVYKLAASQTIYKGALVAVNASGLAIPAADAAGAVVVGVADEKKVSGATDVVKIKVLSGYAFRFGATSITEAMIGNNMYVVDDNTFDDAIGTNGVRAGRLIEFISTTEGWIFIPQGGLLTGAAAATYGAPEQAILNQVLSSVLLLLGLGAALWSVGWHALWALPLFGAVVNDALLDNLRKAYQTIFTRDFIAARNIADYRRLSMEVPSTNRTESYNWLAEVPKMQEWLDERGIKALRALQVEFINKDWEATVGVDRNDLEDDKFDLILPRIQQLAQEAVRHGNELIGQALIDGNTTLGYDSQNFFDTDHSTGESGSQSNLLTGTGTTQAQLKADYKAARAAMRKFKDARGRQMNIVGDVIVCAPDLEIDFRELFNPMAVSETARGLVNLITPSNVITMPELTDANDWYLLATQGPLKPFVFQNRKSPEFTEDRTELVKRKKLYYGVDGRYVVGHALWFFAAKTTNV